MHAAEEPHVLLFIGNREPVFDERDSRPDQHALELGNRAEELLHFVVLGEAHDLLDTSPVVPTSIKQYDLAGRGQVSDIPLEVPLGSFAVVGGGQRYHAANAWIHA